MTQRRRLAVWAGTGCLAAFAILLGAVASRSTGTFDLDVARAVDAHRAGWLNAVMLAVTWLGSNWVLAPVVLGLGVSVLAVRRDPGAFVAPAASLLASDGMYLLAKAAVERVRPPLELGLGGTFQGWAFPSGHATAAVAVWGTLAVVLVARRRIRATVAMTAAAVIALAVGASRVYLGAHWITDVLGGWALGGVVLCAVIVAGAPFTRPSPSPNPVDSTVGAWSGSPRSSC
ncbi:MAG: phosphatase PAP2 family protein [Actinobacteria bacterium]|nr:phosphatase PAP2 family protein [Actinomycetota bacterium]